MTTKISIPALEFFSKLYDNGHASDEFYKFLKNENLISKYDQLKNITQDQEEFIFFITDLAHVCDFNRSHKTCKVDFIGRQDIVNAFVLRKLISSFDKIPQTEILNPENKDDFDDDDLFAVVVDSYLYFVEETFSTHRHLLDNNQVEEFFVKSYKDMILSEKLARIVNVNEEKLKQEDFFKNSLKTHDCAVEIADEFLQDLNKFINFIESQNL